MFAFDQPSLIQGDGNVNVPLVASNVSLTKNNGNSEACKHVSISTTIKRFLSWKWMMIFLQIIHIMRPSPSDEIQMLDLLQYFDKFEIVVFQHVNQTNSSNKGKGVSIDLNSAPNPEGHRICGDTFHPINFPSPTVSITPTYDLIAATS